MSALALTWRLDGLALFFGLVTVVIGALVTVYAVGHARRHASGYPGSWLVYALFLVSMVGVILAADAFTFLVAWETMSLASFALVLSDHRTEAVRRAAWAYLVMTHAATALLIAAFLMLARQTGSLVFADWTAAATHLDPLIASVVFLLGLAAFGTKAGMIPLHVWLPRAHPVAPAPVSALMSGVMIKLGIYGLVRLTMEWLPAGPAWWGGLLIVLASASCVLGVLYALMQHDLKRLLAYHSIENIGIILLGLAVAVIARSIAWEAGVALGLAAALFHVANHATFKALLFMGAGAIDAAVGHRELEHLGGLVRRMPVTAVCFLVGSAAISALPPLNGFASEWLTFQSLLGLGRSAGGALALLPLLAGGALALTGALAVACFVKAFGVSFLALPRGPRAAAARDAGPLELAAMLTLAAGCVVLGLGSAAVVRVIGALVPAAGGASLGGDIGLAIEGGGRLAVPALAVALLALAPLPFVLARAFGPVRRRAVATWACGVEATSLNEYSATAFAKPLRLMFRDIVRPVREVETTWRSGERFAGSVRYRSSIAPIFERYLYGGVMGRLVAGARVLRRAQNGSLNTYLGYLLAALIFAVIVTR